MTLVPGASATEDELLAFVAQRVDEAPARPRTVAIIDKMPMTNVGKIYKPELRAMAARRVAEAMVDEACAALGIAGPARPQVLADGEQGDRSARCRSLGAAAPLSGQLRVSLGDCPSRRGLPRSVPRIRSVHQTSTRNVAMNRFSSRGALACALTRRVVRGHCRACASLPEQTHQARRALSAGSATDILAGHGREDGAAPQATHRRERQAGAAGIIGTDAVVKTPPDGYTLLLSISNAMPTTYPVGKLPYDPRRISSSRRLRQRRSYWWSIRA